MIRILELFGGIGSPRIALRNLGIDVKSIDYVEIDPDAVRSYNAMFADHIRYVPQNVIGWNLMPDILIHGSPCQDISIAGHQMGADPGSDTRSSLMWETVRIIRQMGLWRPRIIIWENVKNVLSKTMIKNYNAYCTELSKMGYTSTHAVLDARDFGIPQFRERCFTVSVLSGDPFTFDDLIRSRMRNISDYLEPNDQVPDSYTVTQPSVIRCIGASGIRRATIIHDYAYTITTRQDRTPAQVIDCGNGRYRYLTERECWRLQGYSDQDFERAQSCQVKRGRYTMALYKQAGNSIPIPIFESLFRKIILGETQGK